MPVDETLNQLAPIQLAILVSIVHLEIVELHLLLGHVRCVHGDLHVLL